MTRYIVRKGLHVTNLESRDGAAGLKVRAVCSCGWASEDQVNDRPGCAWCRTAAFVHCKASTP